MGSLKGTMKERYAAHREQQERSNPPVLTWFEMEQQRIDRKKTNAAFDARHVLPKGSRPVCVACSTELRLFPWRAYPHNDGSGKVYGDYGDNLFCGLRCAHKYAVEVGNRMYGKQRGVR